MTTNIKRPDVEYWLDILSKVIQPEQHLIDAYTYIQELERLLLTAPHTPECYRTAYDKPCECWRFENEELLSNIPKEQE